MDYSGDFLYQCLTSILKAASHFPLTGANSIFMRILLDKKYALPYRVVDAVVYHFLRSDLPTKSFVYGCHFICCLGLQVTCEPCQSSGTSVSLHLHNGKHALPRHLVVWSWFLSANCHYRYKNDISADQKEALFDVLKAHMHDKVDYSPKSDHCIWGLNLYFWFRLLQRSDVNW